MGFKYTKFSKDQMDKMKQELRKGQNKRKGNQGGKDKPKSGWRLLTVFLTYLVITVFVVFLITSFMGGVDGWGEGDKERINLSELVEAVRLDEVEKVLIEDNEIVATFKDGVEKDSRMESGVTFVEVLEKSGIESPLSKVGIEVANPLFGGLLGMLITNFLPVLVMILFFMFLFRQAGKNVGGMFDFGKSNAKMAAKENGQNVTFKDAAGVDEARKELEEVVDFLKKPEKYLKLGARIPKGVLLIGPAGTGKTLLARAVANEADVPFYSMAGSEFMEMLVGVGASRVRDLFKKAKDNSPSLIFIDEIESIGRQRGNASAPSHGEQEQTLNQILVEMDGFSRNEHVIVLAATNRPDMLDQALTRPGRFDRTVALQLPDIEGREQIIQIHMNNKPIDKEVSVNKLAKRTVGFSGADIENMLNEAAILAASQGKKQIESVDIQESILKVKLGRESRRVQSEEDKKMTAYHEAGHAIVAKKLPDMDPVHRVSIVSRGLALGFTEMGPDKDRYHQTRSQLINLVISLLGGRAAEEMVFNDMTVGAGNDLERANHIANKMVTEYGMSGLGPIAFGDSTLSGKYQDPFARPLKYSDEMAAKIDHEIKTIIDECYKKAREILERERVVIDRVVDELMKHETLEEDEFNKLMGE